MKWLRQYIEGSDLLKNTSVLVSGTIVAQLVPILLQPILRRYFSPESFGVYSVYTSLLGIFVAVSSIKYDQAIVLPRNDKEAENVLALSLFINIAFCVVSAAIVVLFSDSLLGVLNISERYRSVLYLVPLGIFLISTFQIFNYWLIRKKAFLAISTNKFVRRGVEGFAQIIFAFVKNAKGLVVGDVFGQIGNVLVTICQSVKKGFKFEHLSLSKIRYVARKYSEFPKYNLVPGFMSACSFLLPAIMINKFYTSEYAGYFDLSKLLLSIPMALVASAVSSILLQKVSDKFTRNESVIVDLKQIAVLVFTIAFVEIVTVVLLGETLFCFCFGQEWLLSGEISKILVWSYALNFITSSFTSVFVSLRKIKMFSIWQVCYFISICALFFVNNLSFNKFVMIFVSIEIVCYLSLLILLRYVILSYEKKVVQ